MINYLTKKGITMNTSTKSFLTAIVAVLSITVTTTALAGSKPVGITKGVMEIAGISRNQDGKAVIAAAFAKTSRPCPPFCIQPINPFAPARVDTVGELEILDALQRVQNGDETVFVTDSRTPGWYKKGSIPGAVNIPFTKLNSKALARDPMALVEIMVDNFGVEDLDGVLSYKNAKTLYLFCNGSWCGQSPAAIRALLEIGYPEGRIKYYRGCMNNWN
jgi:rhodanese-related sulfurtransferase